jgi:hypothetical protein
MSRTVKGSTAHAGKQANKVVASVSAAGWRRDRMSKKFMEKPLKGQRLKARSKVIFDLLKKPGVRPKNIVQHSQFAGKNRVKTSHDLKTR